MRNRPVFVPMNSVESAGLTLSEPTIGGSPSGSTHGTASALVSVAGDSSSPPHAPNATATHASTTSPLLIGPSG